MTATAHFASRGFFPFCLEEFTPGDGIVGDLTLDKVMAFYWKLETYSLSFAATVTHGPDVHAFAETVTVFPPSATSMDQGKFLKGGLMPEDTGVLAIASLPQSARKPHERVCTADAPRQTSAGAFLFSRIADAGTFYCSLGFGIGRDAVNAGKYVIEYNLDVLMTHTIVPGNYIIGYFQHPGGGSGGILSDTGTFTIGGIAFPWELYVGTGDTTAGVSLTATSSNFTF